MATFEIKRSSDGAYIYHLRASGNGRIILRGEEYRSKSGCENGITAVKTNAPYDARYERLYAANGQYYFNLKAANGSVIGTSETYRASTDRDQGIRLVQEQAPEAGIHDLT